MNVKEVRSAIALGAGHKRSLAAALGVRASPKLPPEDRADLDLAFFVVRIGAALDQSIASCSEATSEPVAGDHPWSRRTGRR